MITKYINGDITETELRYIAHGVNAQNKMGSGVAKALYEKFPEVKKEYHAFCANKPAKYLLGNYHIVKPFKVDKYIFNLFTQLEFGYDGTKYVNYAAIVDGFRHILQAQADGRCRLTAKSKVAIPKIGCGLAGGDWNIVEQLINDTVGDDLEIWVYELEDSQKRDGRNGDLDKQEKEVKKYGI